MDGIGSRGDIDTLGIVYPFYSGARLLLDGIDTSLRVVKHGESDGGLADGILAIAITQRNTALGSTASDAT